MPLLGVGRHALRHGQGWCILHSGGGAVGFAHALVGHSQQVHLHAGAHPRVSDHREHGTHEVQRSIADLVEVPAPGVQARQRGGVEGTWVDPALRRAGGVVACGPLAAARQRLVGQPPSQVASPTSWLESRTGPHAHRSPLWRRPRPGGCWRRCHSARRAAQGRACSTGPVAPCSTRHGTPGSRTIRAAPVLVPRTCWHLTLTHDASTAGRAHVGSRPSIRCMPVGSFGLVLRSTGPSAATTGASGPPRTKTNCMSSRRLTSWKASLAAPLLR